jgi:hypothetical protein
MVEYPQLIYRAVGNAIACFLLIEISILIILVTMHYIGMANSKQRKREGWKKWELAAIVTVILVSLLMNAGIFQLLTQSPT